MLALDAHGAVERVAMGPGGLQTHVATGHNVLIFFPSDVPAGPSTTLYVGQVVFTVDAQGTFTFVRSSGSTIDVCAALR